MARGGARTQVGLAVASAVALAFAFALGCSSFDEAASPGTDGGADGDRDVAETGATDAADGGGPSTTDSGALIDDDFEVSCAGWLPILGATTTWMASEGRDGGGACLVCS